MTLSKNNHKTALVIDDEVDICLLLTNFLKKKGIDSAYAYTLTDGMKKALEAKPDWIFLDNNLPDGEGIQRIKDFREITPNSKIIMISAFGGLRERAVAIGVSVFVEKPLNFKQIEMAMV